MASAGTPQQPTPERFLGAINAYQQTEAVKAAVELEIFTAIGEGNTTVAAIAKRCEASERSAHAVRFFDDPWLSDEGRSAVRSCAGRGGFSE
jgi:hypothetical protein